MKICAYPFDTIAAAIPWFLTQVEVSTLNLCNVSLTAVLTLVPVVLEHLPPIVLLPISYVPSTMVLYMHRYNSIAVPGRTNS